MNNRKQTAVYRTPGVISASQPWHMLSPVNGKQRRRTTRHCGEAINDMAPHKRAGIRHPAAQSWENILREADSIDPEWMHLSGFYRWWLENAVEMDNGKKLFLNLRHLSRAMGYEGTHAGPNTAAFIPLELQAFATGCEDRPEGKLPVGISKRSEKHLGYDARVRGVGGTVHRLSGYSLTELQHWQQQTKLRVLEQLEETYAEIPRVAEVVGHLRLVVSQGGAVATATAGGKGAPRP